MKKIHPFTTIGLLLALGALACIVTGYYTVGCILGVAGSLLAMKEVSKFSSHYQFFTVFFSLVIAGLNADHIGANTHWMTLSLVFTGLASLTRIMFFRVFSYTSYPVLEPSLCGVAVIAFVAAVLTKRYDVTVLIVSAIPLAFSIMMASGINKDRLQLLDFTKGGYLIEIGKQAPEFELPDQDGNLVKLSAFQGQRDLLLIFVRGDWCPGCHMMLRTYQKEKERFQKKNVMVLAIGPDPVGVNREMVEKLDLDFKVLSDENQSTAMRYGVQIKNYEHIMQDFKEGIPLPASFLVDRTGTVQYVSRPDKVGEFLNPSLIFPILEKLQG
jgi:peroxiredoxin